MTAIQSVVDQSIRDVEIIVVDDGSTDGTDEILQKSKYGSAVSYFKQANQGPASARNLGLEHASGEYVFFLDSDDYLLPDILAIQSSFLDQNPQVGMVYSNGYRIGKGLFNHSIKVPMTVNGDVREDPSANMVDLLIPRNCILIDVAMVRRSVFRVISGFDPSLSACEDWDLWFRLACNFPVVYLQAMAACYISRPGSNSVDSVRNIREALRVMGKIERSSQFNQASRFVLAEFYYLKGLHFLFLREQENSQLCFNKAISYNSRHKMAHLSKLLFKLFGFGSIRIFQAKRNLFSLRMFY